MLNTKELNRNTKGKHLTVSLGLKEIFLETKTSANTLNTENFSNQVPELREDTKDIMSNIC